MQKRVSEDLKRKLTHVSGDPTSNIQKKKISSRLREKVYQLSNFEKK